MRLGQALIAACLLILGTARNPTSHVSEIHHLRHQRAAYNPDDEPALAGMASNVFQRMASDQPAETVTVTNESFYSRLQDAIVNVALGMVLIIFSITMLWYNEKRNAIHETLINRGEKDVRVLETGAAPKEENNNWPVLITGEQMRAATPVKHPQFNLKYEKGCIAIRSKVSVYQWVEKSKTEEKEKLGGGKETTTTYYYEKQWSTSFNDGSNFKTPGYSNTKPDSLAVGNATVWADRVELGNGFVLSDDLKYQIKSQGKVPHHLETVILEASGQKFARYGEIFYTAVGRQNNPQIGDASVTFTVELDDVATVLALQVATKEGDTSFLPYRVIRRPCCPCVQLTEEQEKDLLYKQGKKSSSDLYNEDLWGGIMWCCCWPCNMIAMCCAIVATPELYNLMKGKLSVKECFREVRDRAAFMAWLGRFLGWMLMLIGLNMCFSPFTTFIKIIPFLGPLLSDLASGMIFAFSLLVTIIISMLIIGVAYSLYHPLLGLVYFAVIGGLIASVMVLSKLLAQ